MSAEIKVFKNASLKPFDQHSDAFAVSGQDLVAVGSWSELQNLVTSQSQVIDCEGATVIPGIEDSHLHGYMLGRQLSGANISPEHCADLAAIHRKLKEHASSNPGWVRGFGWVSGLIEGTGPKATLTYTELEGAQINEPIILTDFSGHQAWCNKKALDAAGITANTEDPAGGQIVRNSLGEPTGLLLESAVKLVTQVMPRPSRSELTNAVIRARDILLANGITSYTDPGLGPGAESLDDGTASLEVIDVYKQLAKDSELNLRIEVMLLFGGLGGTSLADVTTGLKEFGPPEIRSKGYQVTVSQLKVFADGIPRSRTSWMSEPYDTHTHGSLTLAGSNEKEQVETLNSIYAHATTQGWQVGIHATGDETISAIADAAEQNPAASKLRNYVIHADLVKSQDMTRLGNSGVCINVQPGIRRMVGRAVEPIIGRARTVRRLRLREMKEAGINLALSSDAPVTPADWRVIFASAVDRGFITEPDFDDGQGLSALEAMHALTTTAAYQSHSEQWRGSLTPGKVADFVVLDRLVDWDGDPWQVTKAKPRAVFVGGKLVHGGI
jgi:predicted amidohydrolase YtcJ